MKMLDRKIFYREAFDLLNHNQVDGLTWVMVCGKRA